MAFEAIFTRECFVADFTLIPSFPITVNQVAMPDWNKRKIVENSELACNLSKTFLLDTMKVLHLIPNLYSPCEIGNAREILTTRIASVEKREKDSDNVMPDINYYIKQLYTRKSRNFF